jgi:hypothetical protein
MQARSAGTRELRMVPDYASLHAGYIRPAGAFRPAHAQTDPDQFARPRPPLDSAHHLQRQHVQGAAMLPNLRLGAELAAPPDEIYRMYLDPVEHAEITGAPATVSAHVGAKFAAFNGTLNGMILYLRAGRTIVQTWRSDAFKIDDPDSILIIELLPHGRNHTLVDLQQINVPPQDFAGICHGWEQYYFAPWRELLARRKAIRKLNGKKKEAEKTEEPAASAEEHPAHAG